jgi:hypothetical protein
MPQLELAVIDVRPGAALESQSGLQRRAAHLRRRSAQRPS